MSKALIYIIEDDENILSLETYALKTSDYEVIGFSAAKDFWDVYKKRLPALLLLDIMLPDEDGLQVLEKLRLIPETANIPVIMVTAKASEMDKVKALDIGADDYIVKPFGVMELLSRVKAVLRRTNKETAKTSCFQLGNLSLDDHKHQVTVFGKNCELTYKEYEILKLLLQQQERVFSREHLMNEIWGLDYEGESRTVDMHINTLRKKLGKSGQMIKTVRNVGYKIESE